MVAVVVVARDLWRGRVFVWPRWNHVSELLPRGRSSVRLPRQHRGGSFVQCFGHRVLSGKSLFEHHRHGSGGRVESVPCLLFLVRILLPPPQHANEQSHTGRSPVVRTTADTPRLPCPRMPNGIRRSILQTWSSATDGHADSDLQRHPLGEFSRHPQTNLTCFLERVRATQKNSSSTTGISAASHLEG